MGLDVGAKTIGVALTDSTRTIATAAGVLDRRGQDEDAARVVAWIRAEGVVQVVIGMPLELDGRKGRRARTVVRFSEHLRAGLDIAAGEVAVDFWDERFSTMAAERTLLEANLSRAKRKKHIDAMAAQHILRGWLDAHASVGAL